MRPTRIDAVFRGTVRPLPPEGQPTGMFKTPADGPVPVGELGLEGDEQGDPRVHGGPEKAVHLYPADHYDRLAAARPELGEALAPGVLGENLSTRGLTESEVCVGDLYRAGTALLQVSQPRRPCWKIDHRLGAHGVDRLLVGLGCPGWYFRVVETGVLAAGDDLVLDGRPAEGVALARLLDADRDHRPDPAELRLLAAAPGLHAGWRDRLLRRAGWLDERG